MVKGSYYKLSDHISVKLDENNSHGLKSKFHKRWKILTIIAILLVILVFLSTSIINPVTKISSKLGTVETISSPVSVSLTDERNGKGHIRYKHTRRHLPSCIIIGARKAGTRALLSFLNLHPQIVAAKQEVHFFDDNYERGLDWYRKSMPYSFPEQITIEKSPAYFVSEEVPERIANMNSSIRLLLIVRDPVERTISDYNQLLLKKKSKGKTWLDFEDLALNSNGEVNRSFNAVKRSIYSRHMARWLKRFPLHQFHIISGEGLVDNPLPEIKAIEDFLKVDHRITSNNFFFNETRGFYCIRNETMQKCLNPSKGRTHPYVRPEVIQKLRRFFRPYNEKFYQMVEKNFGWP